jgi:hypothetical protein
MRSRATPRARRWAPALGLLALWPALSGKLPAQSADATEPKLAGTWTWTWKDAGGQTHRHTMEVEGVGAKLAAREIFDREPSVRVENLKLDGKAVRFRVVRGPRKAEYSGKVGDADHINGTVTVTAGDGVAVENVWKAERTKNIPKP